ncbi:MAG: flagellar hook-basal body complex protein FliE [Micavibrio sp.]|nr:flagellar hook-basal body complex protein FliE [Micavibrio sp.]|tara:strand:+ start:5962 stop:6300 length:339 start_codon:yes stop_codon:yes gene_type:complete
MVDVIQSLAAQRYADMAKNLESIPAVKNPVEDMAVEKTAQGASFADLMKEGINQTIAAQRKSEEMSAKAVTGDADLTEVVSAITKAELALDTVLAVRDRLVSSFQEIMRTQM